MSRQPDRPTLREFIRFAIVGAAQNGLYLGVFAIAIALGVFYLLASVLAACVALAFAFTLNRRWTFGGRADPTAGRAVRFVAIWIAMLLLGLPVLALLVDVADLPRVLAQAIVIVIVAPLSYAAQRRWTFGLSSRRCRPRATA